MGWLARHRERRRRRLELLVLGALAWVAHEAWGEHGETAEAGALEIAELVGVNAGWLYPALAALEREGAISSRWLPGPYPRRRVYRGWWV